jgi:hypothetical protein
MESEDQSRVVEVFADVCCPFTHVGVRRFVEHRRAVDREQVRLRVRAWPLEIVNGQPLDPGSIAEEVEALRATVAPEMFAGFDVGAFPVTSRPALALAAAAYRRDLPTGEAVSLRLRELLFERGQDIADPSLLAAVERHFDVRVGPADEASVAVDHSEGQGRGVIGSPHFFTPDGSFFCPALDISRDERGGLHIAADDRGFEDFLAACFR